MAQGADLSYDAIELGKSYGPYKYPLSERIARILEATENPHPWHHGRSPWGPPVASPSILGSICMRFIDWIAPIAPGTLHARQDVRTDAALRLDRQPIAYGTFVEKYERRRRRWAVFEARFRDETGLIIGHGRTTMAFPERVETADERAEKGDPKPAERKGELTPITRTITQEKMTGFSEDSANARRGTSIHINPDVAKQAGFETTIAQGMMAADYISEMMTGVLGKEWFAYADLSLTFLQPILCGDTLTANGRLKDETMEGAVLHKGYEVWAENQRGEAVAAGSASSLVMPGR
ncbi:MAG: MaoC family dehydratase [Chloroflexota bacterium]|nr:MaoC family dehydratase [Chloroflexota bacterium]